MKILVLSDFYPPYYIGGYELQCENQVEELRRRGHEVIVLTSRWQVEEGTTDARDVFRLLDYRHYGPKGAAVSLLEGFRGPLRLGRRVEQLTWSVSARRNRRIAHDQIGRVKPDVVFVWNLHSVDLGPLVAAQQAGVPVVVNLYDYWLADLKQMLDLEPNPVKRWYQRLIKGVDFSQLEFKHLLVCSRALSETYQELGFDGGVIEVIPLGLPDNLILGEDAVSTSAPEGSDRIRLIFVGRLDPRKGVEVGVEGLALLARHKGAGSVYLDIVGTGSAEYEAELRRLVADHQLEDQVTFAGRMDREEVLARYASYDALLFPSLWVEPFGLTVIEAMARGLPVIAADHGGPAEIITDGEDGLLVPPGDASALAAAVQKLADDPGMARQIRLRALRTVRENYALTEVVDRVEAYLQAAAGS
jgi:glycosyltransferase involved in cell wall biosynthesis